MPATTEELYELDLNISDDDDEEEVPPSPSTTVDSTDDTTDARDIINRQKSLKSEVYPVTPSVSQPPTTTGASYTPTPIPRGKDKKDTPKDTEAERKLPISDVLYGIYQLTWNVDERTGEDFLSYLRRNNLIHK